MKTLTVAKVNKAIAHTGLTLIKGKGYFYFHDAEGNQVGESLMVYSLNQAPLEWWVSVSEFQKSKHDKDQ